MTVEVKTRGLDKLRAFFDEHEERSGRAAVMAVNYGARRANTVGRRRIQEQVAFASRYLQGSGGDGKPRLGVVQFASDGKTEAVVRARERPTSLARFAVGSKTPGRRNPKVNVGGAQKPMRGTWLMKLRAGSGDDDAFNVGLAIRLPKGQRLRNKKVAARPIGRGAFLLYGPSVAQVFRDVAADMRDEISDDVEREFVRQYNRTK